MLAKTKHAIVAIAILAAIITPSGDPFTMIVFMAPMLALYAVSIGVVAIAGKH